MALGAGEKEALAGKPTANLPAYDALPPGQRGRGRLRRGGAGRSAAGDRLLRARGGAGLHLRARVGAALPRPTPTSTRSARPPRRTPRRRRRRSSGRWRSRPAWPRAHLALGDYYKLVRGDPAARARGVHPGARSSRRTMPTCSRGSASSRAARDDWDRSQAGASPRPRRSIRARSATARRLTYNLLRLRPLPRGDRVGRPGTGARPARTRCLRDEGHGVPRPRAIWPGPGRVLAEAASGRSSRPRWCSGSRPTTTCSGCSTSEQQKLLLRLPPGPFDDDRAELGPGARRDLRAPGRPRARPGLRRFGTHRRRGAAARRARRRAAPCAAGHSRWPTSGRKAEAIREGRARRRARCRSSKDAYNGPVHAAPARADLPARRRAGEGARPARAAAQDPVLALARRGSRSTRRSIRCGRTRGSRSWWRRVG